MGILKMMTSNYIINVGVASWISAQILKTIFTFIATKRFEAERLFGAGGMPSSHSALTISISIAVARKLGFSSVEFGIALTLAAIVMYDAMGVRRAAGEQAKVLNKMMFEFTNFPFFPNANRTESDKEAMEEKRKELKEYLGHTPFEVLGGCLLGILVAIFIPVG